METLQSNRCLLGSRGTFYLIRLFYLSARSFSTSQAGERPAGVLGDERIAGCHERFEPRNDPCVSRRPCLYTGVAERDAGVAYEASPLRAAHGAPPKHFTEVCFAERRQPF